MYQLLITILIIGCYLIHPCYLSNLVCIDKLPKDFSESGCRGWKCSDMAGNGPQNHAKNFCNEYWKDYRHCVPISGGMVKDYCRASCYNCSTLIYEFYGSLRTTTFFCRCQNDLSIFTILFLYIVKLQALRH